MERRSGCWLPPKCLSEILHAKDRGIPEDLIAKAAVRRHCTEFEARRIYRRREIRKGRSGVPHR